MNSNWPKLLFLHVGAKLQISYSLQEMSDTEKVEFGLNIPWSNVGYNAGPTCSAKSQTTETEVQDQNKEKVNQKEVIAHTSVYSRNGQIGKK